MTRRSALAGLACAAAMLAAPNSDDAIYDQVRLRLAEDPDLIGGRITVEVKAGVVTLTGKVRTERARSKAPRTAKKVKGVKSVENQLEVDPNLH
ncbi:MAG: BON domain-containing protein [Bryobacteraceae bacterium]